MSATETTGTATRLDAVQAQAAFEAMFGHTPRIDVRTPAQVKAARAAR